MMKNHWLNKREEQKEDQKEDFNNKVIVGGNFEDCIFVDCHIGEATLKNCTTTNCTFNNVVFVIMTIDKWDMRYAYSGGQKFDWSSQSVGAEIDGAGISGGWTVVTN
jgi:uncharacterized protein YjbI with pentapeptide repeats